MASSCEVELTGWDDVNRPERDQTIAALHHHGKVAVKFIHGPSRIENGFKVSQSNEREA
jgi:hypothetical protein